MSAAVAIALINAIGVIAVAIIGVVGRRQIRSDVADVHAEVRTGNGQTIAALAEATEGRRIRDGIPAHERTASEQHYVDELPTPTGDLQASQSHKPPAGSSSPARPR